MLRGARVHAREILRCAAGMGVASLKLRDSCGMCSIGRCYPGIAADLLAELGGDLPGFVPLWRELRRACGAPEALEGLFLADVFCCEIDGTGYRMRYMPQARVPDPTGGRRTAREIDILIA